MERKQWLLLERALRAKNKRRTKRWNNCSTIVTATAVLFFLVTVAKHSTFSFTFASASFSPRDNFRTFQWVCVTVMVVWGFFTFKTIAYQNYSKWSIFDKILPKLLKMKHFQPKFIDYSLPKLLKMKYFRPNAYQNCSKWNIFDQNS